MATAKVLLCAALLAWSVGCARVAPRADDAPTRAVQQATQAEGRAPTGRASTLSAEQILQRSARAYQNLKFYSGTSTVVSVADMGSSKLNQTASARIQFARPGKLRIQGLDTGGKKFGIVSDGARAWSSWAIQNGGAWQKASSASQAISGMTGVAALAPTLIPAALGEIDIRWAFAPAYRMSARLQGRERIGGEECDKVEVKADAPSTTWTFWVSSRDFLLRQAREDQSDIMEEMKKQIEELPEAQRAQVLRAMGNSTPQIKSTMSLHIFAIDSLNGPLDAALFQKPT